jgi:TatD DNase family protein
MFVDSHVNLHGEQFQDDLDAVVQRARDVDVSTMLTICCKLSEFESVLAVAEKYDDMYASVGTHPHEARENPGIKADDLIKHTSHPKVIGIGETGLDFHYNYSDSDDQYANFRAHIDASRQTQLPLIIHSRNADTEMADILEAEMKNGEFPALLHCYTGGEELARRAADLGLYFSLSGILSFKNAHEMREIAKKLPEDRLLIETDCPYLAPIPYRGRRNEPAFVVQVAEALAAVKNWTIEETAARTADAFFDLFTKAKRPAND